MDLPFNDPKSLYPKKYGDVFQKQKENIVVGILM